MSEGRAGVATAPRRVLLAGGIVTVAGLAVAAMAPVVGTAALAPIQEQQSTGGVLVLAGWALLGWGLHAFGRAG